MTNPMRFTGSVRMSPELQTSAQKLAGGGAARPDELVAQAARELASRENINLGLATERVLRERPDLADPYWKAFGGP